MRMTPLADASKPPNWSPSAPARFAASRENGGKAVGLRPCVTGMPEHTEQKSDGKEISGRKKELVRQIGEPLRTIVVEPLELPVQQPAGEPETFPASAQPEPEQVPVAQ